MIARAVCPPFDRLRAFAIGRVSPHDCEVLARHVADCSACLARLQGLEGEEDALLQALQSPAAGAINHHELQPLLDRLQALPPDAATIDRDETLPLCADATSRPDAPTSEVVSPEAVGPLPRQFGRYTLLRRLGVGGMGQVYLAHDSQLDREVALKIPQLSQRHNHRDRQRFLREARAAATIVHRHICPVYDVGEIDGTPFLTMQYVAGRSLADRLRSGAEIPSREAVELILQVADGLAAAHAGGVIHRDVKAENILLAGDTVPLLTDFGLARRFVAGEVEVTLQGTVLGTPGYMAPEQARGELAAVGAAADVYSLGVVLYELLAGRRPFTGTAAEVLAAVIHEAPPAFATLGRTVDPALEAIIRKALAKSASDRYASMSAFAGDLRSYLHAGSAVTGSGGRLASILTARVQRWRKRRYACIGLVCAALLVAAALIQIWNSDQATTQQPASRAGPAVIPDATPVTPREELPPPVAKSFAIPLNGLTGEEWLVPQNIPAHWRSSTAFAELRTVDLLEYPTIPATRFVFETEIEFHEPGRSVEYRFVDLNYRLWVRLQWVSERNSYRAILQRYHKQGSWVIGQYYFSAGGRLALRLVVCDGMSQLYRGEQLILQNPTIAAERALQIAMVGENGGGVTIHSCRFRPLTEAEVAAAEL